MSLKGLLKNVKEVFLASKRGYIILLTKFKVVISCLSCYYLEFFR